MQKAFFYVGSNNETHELEVGKIEATLVKHFDGFTASEVVGYWKGSKERTLKVEVVTDESPAFLARVAKELAKNLSQDAVMMEIVESNVAFIQA